MGKKFVYFYLMKNKPEIIKSAVSAHVKYWKDSNLEEYVGGPFMDRSGGLIIFKVKDIAEAEQIIIKDPFIMESLIESKWIKEWVVE